MVTAAASLPLRHPRCVAPPALAACPIHFCSPLHQRLRRTTPACPSAPSDRAGILLTLTVLSSDAQLMPKKGLLALKCFVTIWTRDKGPDVVSCISTCSGQGGTVKWLPGPTSQGLCGGGGRRRIPRGGRSPEASARLVGAGWGVGSEAHLPPYSIW